MPKAPNTVKEWHRKLRMNPYFKVFSTVRFAIPALFAFAAAMTYGTVQESLYGTEYVRYAVYHSWWFYLIQAAIVASIVLSVVERLPFRKKLTGFYLVHFAMIVLMIGALVTWYFGIDGSVEIGPDGPSNQIRLPENVLVVTDGQQQYVAPLPQTSSPASLSGVIKLEDGTVITPLRYLPFAGMRKEWKKSPGAWSSEWLVKNDQFEQKIELVDQPGATAQADLGPLHMEVAPAEYFEVLQKAITQKGYPLFLYNALSKTVTPIPAFEGQYKIRGGNGVTPAVISKMSHGSGSSGIVLYRVQTGDRAMSFVPGFSPMPLNDQLAVDASSEYRLVALQSVGARSTVIVSRVGDAIKVAYGKGESWTFTEYKGEAISLPWMGFRVKLLSEKKDAVLAGVLDAGTPSKDEQSNMKAALVRVAREGRSEEQWATSRADARFELAPIQAFLGNREIPLPFSMTLERFKMDQVPGTERPASYESFVKVKDGGDEKTVHVFMNNPYKAAGYTFYQSSYFQDEQGRYHSVLSVNKDPGRPIKYAGSILLVLALIIHFMIIYGHIKFNEEKA